MEWNFYEIYVEDSNVQIPPPLHFFILSTSPYLNHLFIAPHAFNVSYSGSSVWRHRSDNAVSRVKCPNG